MLMMTDKLTGTLQTHAPDRALKNWEEKIKQKTSGELEEDLLQTYSAFRFLQRTK